MKGVLSTDIDEKTSINEKGTAFGATRLAEEEFGDEDGRPPTERRGRPSGECSSLVLKTRMKRNENIARSRRLTFVSLPSSSFFLCQTRRRSYPLDGFHHLSR